MKLFILSVIGRIIEGIGGGNLSLSQCVIMARWFYGKETGLVSSGDVIA